MYRYNDSITFFFTDSLMIMQDLNSIPKFDQTSAALSFQEMKTPPLTSLPNSLAKTHKVTQAQYLYHNTAKYSVCME